jgi:hypothetical protein
VDHQTVTRDVPICVQLDGTQHADGRVERHVVIDDEELNAAEARQLATALLEGSR